MKDSKVSIKNTFFGASVSLLLLVALVLFATDKNTVIASEDKKKEGPTPAVFFEINKGQFPDEVKYFIRGHHGHQAFITEKGLVLVKHEKRLKRKEGGDGSQPRQKTFATAVRLGFSEDASFDLISGEELGNKTNYLKGTQENWVTGVKNFNSVRMAGNGGAIVFRENSGGLSISIDDHSGRFLNSLELSIEGAKFFDTDEKGNLVISTDQGPIQVDAPTVRYGNTIVGSRQKAFFSKYGDNIVLVPTGLDELETAIQSDLGSNPTAFGGLRSSTFVGGSSYDETVFYNNGLSFGDSNYQVIAGNTTSIDFPTQSGGFETTNSGGLDCFIQTTSFEGQIGFSTYVGGNGRDELVDAAVDTAAGLVFTGVTDQGGVLGFPTSNNAYDDTHNGSEDVFLTILDPSGAFLTYSSFYGGTDADRVQAMSFVGDDIIVGGYTRFDPPGAPFPTTAGAIQTSPQGDRDGFLFAVNYGSLSTLKYSTFLGGGNIDSVFDITSDVDGNAYVTGATLSNGLFDSFPTTSGAYSRTINGSYDVFVSKVNPSGSALVYSTFIGGSSGDFGSRIVKRSDGSVVVTGMTEQSTVTFPTTADAHDRTQNGGLDVFLTILNPDGSDLISSTLLGGAGTDLPKGLAVSRNESRIVVAGETSGEFPTTQGAYDRTHNGEKDVFVSQFTGDLRTLNYSTYIGGSKEDILMDIGEEFDGHLSGVGTTEFVEEQADRFPMTLPPGHNGGHDGFRFAFGELIGDPAADFDYDGDGKADYSVFRRSLGEFWNLRSSDNGNNAFRFGSSTDIPVPSDYTGDGETDPAFFRPSTGEWFVIRSDSGGFFSFPFGANGDVPVSGRFFLNPQDDYGVYRDGTWFMLNSDTGQTRVQNFGSPGDHPLVGDFDGDNRADIAVYKPQLAQFWILRSTFGLIAYQFGQAGDHAFVADMTGDGTDDIGIFRPSTGFWYVLRSDDGGFYGFPFGTNGDIPVPADYDGDGTADPAVFRPSDSTWYTLQSTSGSVFTRFGAPSDEPIPAVFNYQP